MTASINASTSSGVIVTSDTSGALALQTASTTAMTIDTSQNVGIGVTPSAWTSATGLQVQNTAIEGRSSLPSYGTFSANGYTQAGAWKYISSDFASRYTQYQSQHLWYTAPSGTAGNAITFTQAMTLDASGKLLIGTTSAIGSPYIQSRTTNSTTISGSYAWNSTDQGISLINESGTTGTGVGITMLGGSGRNSLGAIYMVQETGNALGALAFYTGGGNLSSPYAYERMRLDSSGILLVGKTADTQALAGCSLRPSGGYFSNTGVAIYTNMISGTGDTIQFRQAASPVGSISVTASATAYNTSSDYRLKENVQPMIGALDVVSQLKPVTYIWKKDGSNGQGFIAHELQSVVPDCVTGQKDAVDEEGNPEYQGIDTSFLVATLTAALQETKALIDTQAETINALTARIVALESK